MKKVFAVCLLAMLLIIAACAGETSDLVRFATRGNGSGIVGSIGDYSESLPKMLDYADLIVIAKVIRQKDFGNLSVLTEVKVGRTVKGKEYDTIQVLQLKDGYELILGEKYLLALVTQRPDYEEDYYAVCASFQGAFRQVEDGIEVYDKTFLPEIQRFVTREKKEFLPLDELADWFNVIIKK